MYPFKPLNVADANWCVHRLPRKVKDLLVEHAGKLIVAGGFIRSCISNEPVNDVDLFAPSKELAYMVAMKLADENPGRIHETANAYTIDKRWHGTTVQIIHRWTYDEPMKILDSFDFTVAQAAIWYQKIEKKEFFQVDPSYWNSLCGDSFYQDLAAKRLIYLKPFRAEDAGGSMLRVLKFYQRGYRIPIDSLGAVIARLVAGMDIARIGQATFQGSEGIETRLSEPEVGRIVTGLLREVDPAIDPTHVAHLPAQEASKSAIQAEAVGGIQ